MLSISVAFTVFSGVVMNTEFVMAADGEPDTTQNTTIDDENRQNIAWENYGQTIYNTASGLNSNNVSSVAQTSDGMVWIGTDKGLIMYDGNEFTEYGPFYHFDGVNDMIRTADGGVWFATTTYGGAIYLGSRFQHFDDVSEYASNYATSIVEGKDGYIYVGTLKNMIAINPNSGYTVTELVGSEYYYVTSTAAGEKMTAAVTVNGDMVFVKDAVEVGKIKLPFTGSTKLAYVDGYFIVGNGLQLAVVDENDIQAGIKFTQSVPVTGVDGKAVVMERLHYDGERLWVLLEDKIGYFVLGTDGVAGLDKAQFYTCPFDDFAGGFTDIMVDYQGNYWISSSKGGILLMRKSDFTDELLYADADIDTINSVLEDDGILYVATDSGVLAFDADTKDVVSDAFAEEFGGGRIVDIIKFNDRKYVAVYGEGVYDESGELVVDALRVNRLQELDGELYVLTDNGCLVWDGENITADYKKDDGMSNTAITSAISGVFGRTAQSRTFLGSAGAGIYVFEDGSLVEVMDENTGLPSRQVNDMTAYGNGFFIATDNGVVYYNGKKAIVPERMPNAVDGQECKHVFVRDGKLYAVCTSGLFVMELDTIFGNDESDGTVSYELYGEKEGFLAKMTDGGHGFMDYNGRIYLSCRKKLYSYIDSEKAFDISSIKLMVQSVKADERAVEVIENGDNSYEVNLPKDANEIDILCSVPDFSNDDPYVRYIMPGVDSIYTTLRLSELEHIMYEDLAGGSYVFWFELLGNDTDEDGNVLPVHTIQLTINKELKLFEKLWFRMMLLGAAFGVLMYFVLKDRNKKNIEVDKSL